MSLRVILTKTFSPMRRQISKSASNIDGFLKSNIEKCSDNDLKEVLKQIPEINSDNNNIRKCGLAFVDDFIKKYEMCEDTEIKKVAKRWIMEAKGKGAERLSINSTDAELLLDAVNSAQGKYSNLYISEAVPFDISIARNKDLWAEGRLSAYYINPKERQLKEFQTYNRFSGMIEFIKNNPEECDISEYLWRNYYLQHINDNCKDSCETINKMLDIKNKYNTFVYFGETTPEINVVLNYVKKEFELWEKYSKGTAKFPVLLDLSPYNSCFKIDKNSIGVCENSQNIIIKRFQIQEAIRHEMTHLNDLKPSNSKEKIKLTPFEELEMYNGGLNRTTINYAKNNQDDKKAVFAECDMTKVSKAMKEHMKEEGVPEYVTIMPHNKDKHFYKKIFTKLYGKDKTAEIIKLFKSKFHESAFEGIFYIFVTNNVAPNEAKFMLRRKTNIKYRSLDEYFNDSYKSRLILYYLKLANVITKPAVLFKKLFQ